MRLNQNELKPSLMIIIYRVKLYLIIAFLFCLGCGLKSCNLSIRGNKSKIQNQIKAISIKWELNKDAYYCYAEGQYPQIISEDKFCSEINRTIYKLVKKKLEEHKETCIVDSELLESVNDPEHSLYLSFNGGINNRFISVGIYSVEKALGAAYRQHHSFYYNFNLKTKQIMLISDFINLNNNFEKLLFKNLKFDNDYSKKDSVLIRDYLYKTSKVKYLINQDNLELSIGDLIDDLSFSNKQDFIDIPIKDISNLLKIPFKDLPRSKSE